MLPICFAQIGQVTALDHAYSANVPTILPYAGGVLASRRSCVGRLHDQSIRPRRLSHLASSISKCLSGEKLNPMNHL